LASSTGFRAWRSFRPRRDPLYRSYQNGFESFEPVKAQTVATAIKIGNPVNYPKAVRALKWTNGVVEQVSDQEIMDAKALIDRHGIGCEPASGCSLAGTRKLVEMGTIKPHETVVGILTGHLLKDPDATLNYHNDTLAGLKATYPNRLHQVEASVEDITRILTGEHEATKI
jgi:threonine synthase